MKKKKLKIREKIRNSPKSRNKPGKNKRNVAGRSLTDGFDRAPVQAGDEGMEVMSQIILDFARPLLETCNDQASEKKAISLAIFVWNATLLPEQERKQTLDAYLADCQKFASPEDLKTLSAYIDQLEQSKKTRFADNRKKITNCTFGDFGNNRHIEVGYTIE